MKGSKINNKTGKGKRLRKFKAIVEKSRELGFSSIFEAENNGYSETLKTTYYETK